MKSRISDNIKAQSSLLGKTGASKRPIAFCISVRLTTWNGQCCLATSQVCTFHPYIDYPSWLSMLTIHLGGWPCPCSHKFPKGLSHDSCVCRIKGTGLLPWWWQEKMTGVQLDLGNHQHTHTQEVGLCEFSLVSGVFLILGRILAADFHKMYEASYGSTIQYRKLWDSEARICQ